MLARRKRKPEHGEEQSHEGAFCIVPRSMERTWQAPWSRPRAQSERSTLIIGERFHEEEDSHCGYVHGQSGHVQVVEEVVRDLLERVAAHDRTLMQCAGRGDEMQQQTSEALKVARLANSKSGAGSLQGVLCRGLGDAGIGHFMKFRTSRVRWQETFARGSTAARR